MNSRFDLLTQQYDSALAGPEMVSESGTMLGCFAPETPVLRSRFEHQNLTLEDGEETTALAVVVATERVKTEALRGVRPKNDFTS